MPLVRRKIVHIRPSNCAARYQAADLLSNQSVRLSPLERYLDGAGIAYTILVNEQNISSVQNGPRCVIATVPEVYGNGCTSRG